VETAANGSRRGWPGLTGLDVPDVQTVLRRLGRTVQVATATNRDYKEVKKMRKVGERRINKGGMPQVLINIKVTESELTYTWRDVVKDFAMTTMISIDGNYRVLAEILKPDEYPMSIKDETEVRRKG